MSQNELDVARLRRVLRDLNLGQRELARAIGVNPDWFRAVARGKATMPEPMVRWFERIDLALEPAREHLFDARELLEQGPENWKGESHEPG